MSLRATHSAPTAPAAGRTEAMLSLCVLAAGSLLLLIGWSGRAAVTPLRWAGPDASNLRLETLVGSLAFWTGSAAVIWWLLSMSMAFLAAACELRGRHVSSKRLGQWTPAFMRRLALAILGLTLLGPAGAQAAAMAPSGMALSADSVALDAPSLSPPNSRDPSRSPLPRSANAVSEQSTSPDAAGRSHPTDPLNPGWTADRSRPESLDGTTAAPRDHPPTPLHASDSLDPGWTPSTITAEPGLMAPEPRRNPSGLQASHREVVVRPGDSLWVLASRELGPSATDLEIARLWPHWYSANHDVIGPDPDHLLPGTVLRVPARQ
jgi:nucleoid-associated protein YgaU